MNAAPWARVSKRVLGNGIGSWMRGRVAMGLGRRSSTSPLVAGVMSPESNELLIVVSIIQEQQRDYLLLLGHDGSGKGQVRDFEPGSAVILNIDGKLPVRLVPRAFHVEVVLEGELDDLVIRLDHLHRSALQRGCLRLASVVLGPLPEGDYRLSL